MGEINVKENENVAEGGELRGGYAEDTQVASNLDQADFNDLMTRQLVQNNVSLQHQIQQATFENQQRMANATQMFILGLMGKSEISFPKAVVENVEHFSKTSADDNLEDFSSSTSKDTMDNMVDRLSKSIESAVQQATQQAVQQPSQQSAQQAAQLGQLSALLESFLAKIESKIE